MRRRQEKSACHVCTVYVCLFVSVPLCVCACVLVLSASARACGLVCGRVGVCAKATAPRGSGSRGFARLPLTGDLTLAKDSASMSEKQPCS